MPVRDILIFGDDWERHPQTLEHLAKAWARHHRVVWVNSLGHKRLHFSLRYILRAWEKLRVSAAPRATRADNIEVIRPLGIPFHQFRFVRRMNAVIVRRWVLPVLSRLQFKDPIIITNSPVTVELVRSLRTKVLAYYCLDDYPAFPDTFRNMREVERELLSISDIAYFVSDTLFRARPERPAASATMTQGVNVDHFNAGRALRRRTTGKPVIGFMGWITHWVDLELVAEVARRRPEWTFELVGSCAVDVTPYQGIANMRFSGQRSYEELPESVAHFDVGLIPFRINDVTLGSNPLKLLEYFAMGIPVVSTPIPEVERFAPLVRIASTADEWERAIALSLAERGPGTGLRRRSVARKHSWASIADRHLEEIQAVERGRQADVHRRAM